MLSWLGSRYAAGYLVHIRGGGLDKTFPALRSGEGKFSLPLKEIWKDWLKLNTLYTWRTASCEGSESGELVCEDEKTKKIQWSDSQTFRTTGAPPTNMKFEPANAEGEVGFPLTILWDEMPGAASYALEAPSIAPRILRASKSTVDFAASIFRQGGTYAISVKTCADEKGETCGNPATAQFTTATLRPPIITQPETGKTEFIPSIAAKWDKVFGANGYEHQLLYAAAEPEETAECKAGVGSAAKGTTPSVSAVIYARCEGQYSLQIRGCIDNGCKEESGKGQWSNALTFTIEELPGAAGGGLIPCDRTANNPNTPWDDREPCGIEHIFLGIKTIIDFLLFRAAPIILVLLTMATGVVFYTSFGKAFTMAQIMSLWKAAGIGLILISFAWLIVNLFLGLVGYDISIFGKWYEL